LGPDIWDFPHPNLAWIVAMYGSILELSEVFEKDWFEKSDEVSTWNF
jgi:hypothetical protein